MKKNFPIIDKETGREYWISRSVAVLTILECYDSSNEKYVLVVQRGKGTPDPEYVGKYCLPCGYLDFDETTKQAAARELVEETGINIPICEFRLVEIRDDPKIDKRQNITLIFKVKNMYFKGDIEKLLTTKNSEKDEVSSIKFINLKNIDMYEWAFNHDKLISSVCLKN